MLKLLHHGNAFKVFNMILYFGGYYMYLKHWFVFDCQSLSSTLSWSSRRVDEMHYILILPVVWNLQWF